MPRLYEKDGLNKKLLLKNVKNPDQRLGLFHVKPPFSLKTHPDALRKGCQHLMRETVAKISRLIFI
jgi:hypothetical protein